MYNRSYRDFGSVVSMGKKGDLAPVLVKEPTEDDGGIKAECS